MLRFGTRPTALTMQGCCVPRYVPKISQNSIPDVTITKEGPIDPNAEILSLSGSTTALGGKGKRPDGQLANRVLAAK